MPTTPAARWTTAWGPGPARKARSFPDVPGWLPRRPRSAPGFCSTRPDRRIGVAFASGRTAGSSGKAARAACTTVCATDWKRAAGCANAWRPDARTCGSDPPGLSCARAADGRLGWRFAARDPDRQLRRVRAAGLWQDGGSSPLGPCQDASMPPPAAILNRRFREPAFAQRFAAARPGAAGCRQRVVAAKALHVMPQRRPGPLRHGVGILHPVHLHSVNRP